VSDGDDPLASATLAQLYVAQGHLDRAARVLDAVLARDPLHGHALALATRLAALVPARLTAARVEDRAVLTWAAAADTPGPLHLVWRRWAGAPPTGAGLLSSIRCDAVRGDYAVVLEPGPGALAACLATVDAARRLRILAVAEPLVW
jgi:hypothetical protein